MMIINRPVCSIAFLLASVGLLLSGCGSDDSAPAGVTVAREQFASAYAAAYCGALESCCPAANLDFNRDGCLQNVEAGTAEALEESFGYDGESASKCLELLKQGGCAESQALRSACRAVTRTQAIGQECKDSSDCVILPGSDDSHCKEGVCTSSVTSRGVAGSACRHICETQATGTHCIHLGNAAGKPEDPEADGVACYLEDGLTCDSVSFECVERAPEGTTCPTMVLAWWGFCAQGLTCEGTTCQKAGELGQACVGGSATEACVAGAECDQSTNTCVAHGDSEPSMADEYSCTGGKP